MIPDVLPPLPRVKSWRRNVSMRAPLRWLAAGWSDLIRNPLASLAVGLFVFGASISAIAGLSATGSDAILFPAFAGFLIVGPLLAVGLYEKSRRLAAGEPVTLRDMILVKPASGGQILYAGALLCLLWVLWLRSAVIIYALFFGLLPFPGLSTISQMLVHTPSGWVLIGVGSCVGGLFAGFAFAISAFSIPMLLDRRIDAFTAMGSSLALVWNNLAVMIIWGAIVVALFAACLATALVGLIVVFPWLGHATWHAYRDMRGSAP